MAPSRFVLPLLLLLCFLTHNLSSGRRRCVSGELPVFRKMLRDMKKEMEEGVDGGKRWRATVEWDQLRRVPSGPDPLHHNGGSPKKPRTP